MVEVAGETPICLYFVILSGFGVFFSGDNSDGGADDEGAVAAMDLHERGTVLYLTYL